MDSVQRRLRHVSPQLCFPWCHFGSLQLATMVFKPRKSAHATHPCASPSLESGCYAFTTHCWVAVDTFDLVLPWGSSGLLASPHRPVLVAYLCVNLPHQTELPEGRVPQGSQPKCSLWLEHVPLKSLREQVSHGSFTRVTEWGGPTWQAGPASTPHFYSL